MFFVCKTFNELKLTEEIQLSEKISHVFCFSQPLHGKYTEPGRGHIMEYSMFRHSK